MSQLQPHRHKTITTIDTWQPGTNCNHTDTQVKNNHITDSYTWKSKLTPDIWQPETNYNHRRQLKNNDNRHLSTCDKKPTTSSYTWEIKTYTLQPKGYSKSRNRKKNPFSRDFLKPTAPDQESQQLVSCNVFFQCQEYRLRVSSKHWTKSSKNLSRNLLHGGKNSKGMGWIFIYTFFLSIWGFFFTIHTCRAVSTECS